jgi:hypothetical protein
MHLGAGCQTGPWLLSAIAGDLAVWTVTRSAEIIGILNTFVNEGQHTTGRPLMLHPNLLLIW